MQARIAFALALVATALVVPGAHAATPTRVGPTGLITNNLTNEPCASTCTFVQYTDNGVTPAYVSPVTGVITQWQLASGSAGNQVVLRALRPGTVSGTFAGLGTGVPRETKAGLNTFQGERLPISAGDSIGLNDAQGLFFAQGVAGAMAKWWSPALADASGPQPTTDASTAGHSLQLNADVEPDADGDRFGDITQDGCPGDAKRQALPCTVGPTNPILPVLTLLRAKPNSIRFGQGSSISFRISKPAHWTLRFEQKRPGRVKKGKCRLQTKSLNKGRRCTLYTSRGTVSGDGGPGGVTVLFQGALANARSLRSGKYRIKATAQDAIGTSRPAYANLTLKPKLKKR